MTKPPRTSATRYAGSNIIPTVHGLTRGYMLKPATRATPAQDTPLPYQLQVRVKLRRNNQDYGDTSLISQVTVNP